jgi:hypothetical protein
MDVVLAVIGSHLGRCRQDLLNGSGLGSSLSERSEHAPPCPLALIACCTRESPSPCRAGSHHLRQAPRRETVHLCGSAFPGTPLGTRLTSMALGERSKPERPNRQREPGEALTEWLPEKPGRVRMQGGRKRSGVTEGRRRGGGPPSRTGTGPSNPFIAAAGGNQSKRWPLWNDSIADLARDVGSSPVRDGSDDWRYRGRQLGVRVSTAFGRRHGPASGGG